MRTVSASQKFILTGLVASSVLTPLCGTLVQACDLYNPAAPELASNCPKHPPLHIPNWGLQANLRARLGTTPLEWDDPMTWVDVENGLPAGRVPNANDIVLVPTGSSVLVDTTDATAKVVAVSGLLKFARKEDATLSAGTVLVNYDGALDMGIPARPGVTGDTVTAHATLRLATSILPRWYTSETPTFDQYSQPYDPDRSVAYDPRQYSGGLIVLGCFTAAGSPRTGFARLAQAPGASDAELRFTGSAAPIGWQPSDRIALPDTRSPYRRRRIENQPDSQSEIVTMSGANGETVALQTPTRYAHGGNAGAVDLLPHAANLTRNVVITSANYENPTAVRAHVFVNGPARVDIDNVAFVEMGRTRPGRTTNWDSTDASQREGNQIGRYSLHFHHLDGPFLGSDGNNGHDQYVKFRGIVTGCAFENGFTLAQDSTARFPGNKRTYQNKWQIDLHGTTRVLVSGNVMYGATGAGFATEDGNEGWNEIVGNFALNIPGQLPQSSGANFWTTALSGGNGISREDPALLGSEGAGFWLSGSADMLWNNVAADCGLSGILVKPSQARYSMTYPTTPVSPREDWVSYNQPEFNHLGFGWEDADLTYTTPGTTRIQPWQRPMGNNEVYGALKGIETWKRTDTTLRGATVWNCHIGIEPWESEIGMIENFTAYGDPSPQALNNPQNDEWGPSVGINNHFYPVAPCWKNIYVQEFGIGMMTFTPAGGIPDGRVFELEVENATFACPIGMWIGSDLHYKHDTVRPARTKLINCRFDVPPVSGGSVLAIRGQDSAEFFRPGITTNLYLRPNVPDEVYIDGLFLGSKTVSEGSFRFYFNGQKPSVPYPLQSDLASGWSGGTPTAIRLTNTTSWATSVRTGSPRAWCGGVAPLIAWDNPILNGEGFFGLLMPQSGIPAPQTSLSSFATGFDTAGGEISGFAYQWVNKQQKYQVAISIDGVPMATVWATNFQDNNFGRARFQWTVPQELRDGAPHQVHVEIVGENCVIADGKYIL